MPFDRWIMLHRRARAAQRRLLARGVDLDLMGRFWSWYDRQPQELPLEPQLGEQAWPVANLERRLSDLTAAR